MAGGLLGHLLIRSLLARDPNRELESVIKITDHDPRRAWIQMDEYVPTPTVREHLREVLDILLETRRAAGERVCVWVSGFFGSGKSHFLKVLGYLLEDRELIDPDGRRHSSREFLARKLGLETYLPHLRSEFLIKVLYINLLDHDPQDPQRPTISRLIYRHLLESQGLSTTFWVAWWERELRDQGKWGEFRAWVEQTYGRSWEQLRVLHAEAVLRKALPVFFPDLYRSESEAERAILESKVEHNRAEPADVAIALVEEARRLGDQAGRVVVLLDEVGLYIGDQVERLTDLNRLAEQVVERGQNRVLLIATAQEALTDLVPRLTKDRQILAWLQDRFVRLQLLPTDVEQVIAERLLQKTPEGADRVRQLYRQHEGSLRENLGLQTGWTAEEFVNQYPCPPYAVRMLQDIMGTMRGSVEEMRRLSGSERSMLKLVHAILRGEGEILPGAEQPLGWLVSLDLFYDALKADLVAVRSDQVRALEEIESLDRRGAGSGLPVGRVAKALFLLQQVHTRYPCTVSHLTSALADHVQADARARAEQVEEALRRLQQEGWVTEQQGQYRLLTPAEHAIETEIHNNWPDSGVLQGRAAALLREMVRDFRYEHGQIRRRLGVTIEIDGDIPREQAPLRVCLFMPLSSERRPEDIRNLSIANPQVIYWVAEPSEEFIRALERAVAIEQTLGQWKTRTLSEDQQRYRQDLEREHQEAFQRNLPELARRAFLNGRVFVGGVEARPAGVNLEEVLRHHLRVVARQLYTEFIDLPVREEECARILEWSPGGSLPPVYQQLGLISADGQIQRDARPLSAVRAEIQRRQARREDRSGRALLEAFEKPPYGWDPRLVRLLVATLLKMGILRISLQGLQITSASDHRARGVFTRAQVFAQAEFELLPEVDWRQASDWYSRVFGKPGEDTFERTADAVRQEAQRWQQRAAAVSVRARDNNLPQNLASDCERAAQLLEEVAREADPNQRLRAFLDRAEALRDLLVSVRALEGFPFEQYRRLQEFARTASEWGRELSGEAAGRWEQFANGLHAQDLVRQWAEIQGHYAALHGRYREDYTARHQEFQQALREAIAALRQHEAFAHAPDRAEEIVRPLEARLCTASGEPGEELVCPQCRRRYEALNPSLLAADRNALERKLDALLPSPPAEAPPEPLHLQRVVATEAEVEAVAGELRRYVRRAGRSVRVRLEAHPE